MYKHFIKRTTPVQEKLDAAGQSELMVHTLVLQVQLKKEAHFHKTVTASQ